MFYDGTKLISMKDKNGNEPEIYIATGNKSQGKTFFYNRLMVNKFLDKGEKFILLYRYAVELENCVEQFFGDIGPKKFPTYEMTSKRQAKGKFYSLFLNDKPCGFAISVNSADFVRKNAHYFNQCDNMLFDEFMPMSDYDYCPDEVNKFMMIHSSIARGEGKMYRPVKCYLVGNLISKINPYYVALNLHKDLPDNAKYYRGDGFVVEVCMNESAKKEQEQSAFNRAFSGMNNSIMKSDLEGTYARDSNNFVEKLTGSNQYLFTIVYDGVDYAIRQYTDLGLIYISDNADVSYPTKIAVTTADHDVNHIMLQSCQMQIVILRNLFNKGCVRFKNNMCKKAFLELVAIRL